ncbi:MAG: hypothetical protein ACRDGL_09180 [Candidatus Limnocylindrales bacterium]
MALPVYTDALEFLEEEREAWAPFEALESLSDPDLERPTDPSGPGHGWSGRDLAGHLVAWQLSLLAVVKELALGETSPTLEAWQSDPKHEMDALNARWMAEWGARPLAEVRKQFHEVPGELRGYLTVVPESRWLKHPSHLQVVLDDTLEHYADHRPELATILAAGG